MKRKTKQASIDLKNFSEFIFEPPVGIALIVFALIALLFSILEFAKAITY